ncbi:MAG: hypothetical protein HZB26_10780 [Candidatus Hydrogenedentes bacterium]|nr:hypothetical protein [Candidatus Hydrogenedentota bacterium]
MRKLKLALLIIAAVAIMLVCVVLLKLAAQRQDIRSRGPLTIEEINRVAAKWGPAPQANPAKLSHSDPTRIDSSQPAKLLTEIPPAVLDDGAGNAASASTGDSLVDHPTLRGTLTQTEKEHMAVGYRQLYKTRIGTRLGSLIVPSMEFMAVALGGVGLEKDLGHQLFEAAEIAYHNTADWETAKRLYRQALDCRSNTRHTAQVCYIRLAWMEDDPKVADRLLELACPSGDESPYVLTEAASLAYLTGSRELFDYYFDRLQQLDPQQAECFRSYRRGPEGRQTFEIISMMIGTEGRTAN